MAVIDKHNLLGDLANRKSVVLELGCGSRKRHLDSIGVDLLDYDCVDLVGDIYEVLRALPNNSVTEVYSSHFVEHVQDVPVLLAELARILKVEGKLDIVVPHFSNPYFYSDVTHKSFFGLYSMSYFSKDIYLSRKVPTYQREVHFSLNAVHLIFKAAPPFYVRHAFKKMVGVIVNLGAYTKELYEECFCHLIPCYEIRYELRRVES